MDVSTLPRCALKLKGRKSSQFRREIPKKHATAIKDHVQLGTEGKPIGPGCDSPSLLAGSTILYKYTL